MKGYVVVASFAPSVRRVSFSLVRFISCTVEAAPDGVNRDEMFAEMLRAFAL